jgi:hypothetical protein
VKQSSFLSIMPWAAMALGTNMSGWAADTLTNRKVLDMNWCVAGIWVQSLVAYHSIVKLTW